MKTRNRYLVFGLLALALSGSALAHEAGQSAAYPAGAWSGNATIWGNSQGYSGWLGNLNIGAVFGYAPGFVPVAVPLPRSHRHAASCHHAPPRVHSHAYRQGHPRGHARGHGKGYRGHH